MSEKKEETNSPQKHFNSFVVAVFFVTFVVVAAIVFGWIAALVFAVTGIEAFGWIAASVVLIYTLHSGLFNYIYDKWMNLGKCVSEKLWFWKEKTKEEYNKASQENAQETA